MKKLAITLVAAAWVLGSAGCASQTEVKAPTHRWASDDAINAVEYRNDDARCRSQADLSQNGRILSVDSPEFLQYKSCMSERGYVLTAYNK